MNNLKSHWEKIYNSKSESDFSWHSEHLETSLQMIRAATAGNQAAKIIDVGGGTSRLIDDLLKENFTDLTLLDTSGKALGQVRQRIGEKARNVNFIESDILNSTLQEKYFDVWHDRAVFHFLTKAVDRQQYINVLRHSLRPGGTVIIATFGKAGPEKCSGLEVSRYDANGIQTLFGNDFDLLQSKGEIHLTPWGAPQEFIYCMCRFLPSAELQRAA